MPAEKYANIRRKDNIPEDVRTDGKDDAAQIIDELIDKGKWPVSLEELDETTDWSRSHYRNVLDSYYVRVDENNNQNQEPPKMNTIEIPDDVQSVSDYLMGVAKGWTLRDNRD